MPYDINGYDKRTDNFVHTHPIDDKQAYKIQKILGIKIVSKNNKRETKAIPENKYEEIQKITNLLPSSKNWYYLEYEEE